MAGSLPALLALVFMCKGIFIFRLPKDLLCMPYWSYVIFLVSVFIFLLNVNLNHFKCAKFTTEFLSSMFIMEMATNDFWIPLQLSLKSLLYMLAVVTEIGLRRLQLHSCASKYAELFKCAELHTFENYAVSVFFLICSIRRALTLNTKLIRSAKRRIKTYVDWATEAAVAVRDRIRSGIM